MYWCQYWRRQFLLSGDWSYFCTSCICTDTGSHCLSVFLSSSVVELTNTVWSHATLLTTQQHGLLNPMMHHTRFNLEYLENGNQGWVMQHISIIKRNDLKNKKYRETNFKLNKLQIQRGVTEVSEVWANKVTSRTS